MLRKLKFIDRSFIRNHPNDQFLFGDNDSRIGMGGQAKEMRGEINTIGIRVKKAPSMHPDAFYSDAEYDENVKKINEDLARIDSIRTIFVPEDGLGTGFAELQSHAPNTFKYLQERLQNLEAIVNSGG